jgi:hypothetical protein
MVRTYSLPAEGADTGAEGADTVVDTGVLPEGADTVVDTAAEAAEPASEAVEAVEAVEAAAEEAAVSGLAVSGFARELNQPLSPRHSGGVANRCGFSALKFGSGHHAPEPAFVRFLEGWGVGGACVLP